MGNLPEATGLKRKNENDSPLLAVTSDQGWSLMSPCVPLKLADWLGFVQTNTAAMRGPECRVHVTSEVSIS